MHWQYFTTTRWTLPALKLFQADGVTFDFPGLFFAFISQFKSAAAIFGHLKPLTMPQTRNFSDDEMRQLGGDNVAGLFPCDHHIEPSATPTSSVHANPDIVIDAVEAPEGCIEIATACCDAAISKMPSFALFEDARSSIVKRLIPPPRYGFRNGVHIDGLSVPTNVL
jgi:hypothetical protein